MSNTIDELWMNALFAPLDRDQKTKILEEVADEIIPEIVMNLTLDSIPKLEHVLRTELGIRVPFNFHVSAELSRNGGVNVILSFEDPR